MKSYLAVIFLLVAVGCSQTANNNSNQKISSSNAEAPLSRPNLPDEAQTAQSSPTSQMEKEFAEAEDTAKRFWQATVIQCNQEYYYATWNGRNFQIQDCKHMSGPVNTGQVNSPRALSEAERLNGTDPLPIKYEGKSVITLQTCREWNQGFGDSWGQWFDLTHEVALVLTKKKDAWTTQPQASEGQLSKITCVQVNEIDKRYKGGGLRSSAPAPIPARQ